MSSRLQDSKLWLGPGLGSNLARTSAPNLRMTSSSSDSQARPSQPSPKITWTVALALEPDLASAIGQR